MYCSEMAMTEANQPSFWARYWEAAQCVASSGPEFARLSRAGVESLARLVAGVSRTPGRHRRNNLLPH
jgi:hypothetical protein